MKNCIFLLLFSLLSGCVTENINTVLSTHELHEIRLRKLNDFCAKMNEEIVALKWIIEAGWGKTDYITHIQETTEGYHITFRNNGTFTIYHGEKGENGNKGEDGKDGEDGKNGENGTNGKDGLNAPVIGVEKDKDGKYYWTTTLNNITNWLTGENGEKLPVTGPQGDAGEAGTPGQPGTDALLPKLSVDAEGYWTINGIRLLCNGKPVTAAGPQGPQGNPGKDQIETGSSGDLLIKEVITHTDSVVFVLAHDGLRFPVPREVRSEIRIQSPGKGTFYYGQTLTIRFTCSGVSSVTALVPPGWQAITDFETREVTVTAPAEDDLYGEREGELTLITANPTGESITANLKLNSIRAYKITGWDFTNSRVYHILNTQGIKIAEICTEYIPGYSESQQAIVIYPYDIQTQSYGKGLIVNGGGEVRHNGSQYSGMGPEGKHYPTVFVTYNGISIQQPAEYVETHQEAWQVTDFEGNIYPVTKIGNQYWITRNWNATRYMDGSPVTFENDFSKWQEHSEAGAAQYGYPNNNPALRSTYGLIYNMAAIKTGKLFPEGWDIPTCDPISGDNDYQDLLDYLGKNNSLKLRSTSWGNDVNNGDWIPNRDLRGNNLSGFNASPTGYLIGNRYDHLGEFGVYWSSSLLWNKDHYAQNYHVMNIRNYIPDVAIDGLNLIGDWGSAIRLIKKD